MKKKMFKRMATASAIGTMLLLPLSAAAENASRVVSVSGAPSSALIVLGLVSLVCIGAAAAYKTV